MATASASVILRTATEQTKAWGGCQCAPESIVHNRERQCDVVGHTVDTSG